VPPQHVPVDRRQPVKVNGVDRGVKVVEAAEEEAEGAAELPVRLGHLLKDAGADLGGWGV
jgi:hypothetical protein